jgi:two-component system invasion response regulator UvrY
MKQLRLRILLADDHALVRAGTREILSRHFEADFIEAKDASETMQACNCSPCDLILLDISMPGRSGLDLLGDLQKCCPKTPVLVLSAHDEEQFATRALRAGAAGYLSKTNSPTELVRGVERVLAGGRYVSEKFAESLALALQKGRDLHSHEALSAREFEVLRMIVAGKSGKEIAADLSISFKTVSTYRTRLMQKLKVHSNAELAQYAAREGLT